MIKVTPGESLTSACVRWAVDSLSEVIDLLLQFGLVNVTLTRGWRLAANVDWPVDADFASLAYYLGASEQAMRDSTLCRIADILGARFANPDRRWRGTRPCHYWFVVDRDRFCPLCLMEEAIFRLIWRLRPLTVCERHGILLVDACPACGALEPLKAYLYRDEPLVRPEFVDGRDGFPVVQWPHQLDILRACGRCGADLREAAAIPIGAGVLDSLRPMFRAFEGGPVPNVRVSADAREFLEVEYQMARLLLSAARRGYGNPLCLALFEGRSPRIFGDPRAGILADVRDMHVLSVATMKALERWPDSYRELVQEVRERGDAPLLGVSHRQKLPASIVSLIRSSDYPETRCLHETELGRYAIGASPSGRLTPTEGLRALAALWKENGPSPNVISSKHAEAVHMFPRFTPLNAIIDNLFAAVEDDGSLPAESAQIRGSRRNFFQRRAGSSAYDDLLRELRAIASDRRNPRPGCPALFAAPHGPNCRLTDYAWLLVRPEIPVRTVADRLYSIRGPSLNLRGLLAALLVELWPIERPTGNVGARGAYALRVFRCWQRREELGSLAMWRAVKELCKLAGSWVEGPVTIERPIITDRIWRLSGLEDVLALHGRKPWLSGALTYRQVFEAFLDSWLTAEVVLQAEARQRAGVPARSWAAFEWLRLWYRTGQMERALRLLLVAEPVDLKRLLYERILAAVIEPAQACPNWKTAS